MLAVLLLASISGQAHPIGASRNDAVPRSGSLLVKLRGPAGKARFGQALEASGDTLLVGAPGVASGSGAAYFFTEKDGRWSTTPSLKVHGTTSRDAFGDAVAIDGTTAVVGAPVASSGTYPGAIYIYTKVGGKWSQTPQIIEGDVPDESFGAAVSVDGDFMLVGAPGASGAAYLYSRSEGQPWGTTPLAVFSGQPDTSFGSAVGIGSDFAVVGDPGGFNDTGGAYVFSDVHGIWNTFQSGLVGPADQTYANFGNSVSVWQDWFAVGAVFLSNNRGAAYVYKSSVGIGGSSPSAAFLGKRNDEFGTSVALSDSDVLVGAVQEVGSDPQRGYASAYELTKGDAWNDKEPVTVRGNAKGDWFGGSVSISDGTAFVGAVATANFEGAVYGYRL